MAKKSAMGTSLELSIASVYTAIGQILSVTRSDTGDVTFDGTCLDSAADGNSVVWTELIQAGVAEPGKVAFEIFLDPTNTVHQDVVSYIGQGNRSWKTVYANSGGAFDGFTSAAIKYNIDAKAKEGIKMSVDLTLTGPVTQF
jgi:Lambda phage tail tube protein, TTP